MKFQKSSVSKLSLTDLLRRKRTNLTKYIADNGICSYDLLSSKCFSIGVIAPTEEQFLSACGSVESASSCVHSEGLVVLHNTYECLFNTHIDEINPEHQHIQMTDKAVDDVLPHAQAELDTVRQKRKKKSLDDS